MIWENTMAKRAVTIAGLLLGGFLLLIPADYARAEASYESLLKNAIDALADAEPAKAESILNQQPSYRERTVYKMLMAVAQLELQQFDNAQSNFRALAKRVVNGDASVKPAAEFGYAELWLQRKARGVALPLAVDHYSNMDAKQLLNINLNRRLIGLPFIGDVTQWRDFDRYLHSSQFARHQPAASEPRQKPTVEAVPAHKSDSRPTLFK